MKVVRFFVRQRALALDRKLWRRVARSLLEECLERRDFELGVHFIGAIEMTYLNETYLGHKGSTDVLTFDHQDNADHQHLSGEIFICVDDAQIHARRYHVRWQFELTRYLIHGILHLEGCNDTDPRSRRMMKRQEDKLLKALSARFDLGKLGKLWH